MKKVRNTVIEIFEVEIWCLLVADVFEGRIARIGNDQQPQSMCRQLICGSGGMALFSLTGILKPIFSKMKRNSKNTDSPTMREELSSKLGKLFEEELRDIYWAEKALTKAIPKMIKNATSEELAEALEHHLQETQEHVARVEQIFSMLEKEPRGKKCEGMDGIIREAQEFMKDSEKGVMRDAAIISAAQKVEHYEISSYGTLRTFAQTIGLNEAVSVLESTLEEEKNADKILTEVAISTVNLDAASESEDEEG